MTEKPREQVMREVLTALIESGRRRNKYNAKPVSVDGHFFASGKEMRRYSELKLAQDAGEIHGLRLQVPIELCGQYGLLRSDGGRRLVYVADFTYWQHNDDYNMCFLVVEDAKGLKTGIYRLKKAILRSMGIEITER